MPRSTLERFEKTINVRFGVCMRLEDVPMIVDKCRSFRSSLRMDHTAVRFERTTRRQSRRLLRNQNDRKTERAFSSCICYLFDNVASLGRTSSGIFNRWSQTERARQIGARQTYPTENLRDTLRAAASMIMPCPEKTLRARFSPWAS